MKSSLLPVFHSAPLTAKFFSIYFTDDRSSQRSPRVPRTDQRSIEPKEGQDSLSKDVTDGHSKGDYESDDSEASSSRNRGSIDGTSDLPEVDQRRTESKWKAREKWIRAVQNLNSLYISGTSERGEELENKEDIQVWN